MCLNLKKARIECMHSTRYRTREWSNRRFLAYLKVIWHANFFFVYKLSPFQSIAHACTCHAHNVGLQVLFFLYHIKFSNVNRKFSNFQYFLPLWQIELLDFFPLLWDVKENFHVNRNIFLFLIFFLPSFSKYLFFLLSP